MGIELVLHELIIQLTMQHLLLESFSILSGHLSLAITLWK